MGKKKTMGPNILEIKKGGGEEKLKKKKLDK